MRWGWWFPVRDSMYIRWDQPLLPMPCWRWAERELGWRCRAVSPRWCHRGVPACPCPCCSGAALVRSSRFSSAGRAGTAAGFLVPAQTDAGRGGEGMRSRRFAAPAPFSMGRCVAFPCQPAAQGSVSPGLRGLSLAFCHPPALHRD